MAKQIIRVVLVETSHPGNIGSVARAMKTMGLNQLYLVNPVYFPHPEASALAANATDILENATICSSYMDAIADCHWVVGTGSFLRDREWPVYTPKQVANTIANEKQDQQVALVFGREKNGLSNEELDLCHAQLQIPANPDYNSLNLAASVQIVCYEIYQSLQHKKPILQSTKSAMTVAEKERILQSLEEILTLTGLHSKDNPRLLFHKIRRMLNSGIKAKDKNLILGILKNMQQSLSKK